MPEILISEAAIELKKMTADPFGCCKNNDKEMKYGSMQISRAFGKSETTYEL